MFGLKIISEEKYQSEQRAAKKMVELHDELVKKNARLECDIQSLRDQNANLQKTNGRRKEEIDNLIEKNRRLKELDKAKSNPKFEDFFTLCTPEHCDTCTHEQKDCKKFYLERKTDVVCVCPKPSFRAKK